MSYILSFLFSSLVYKQVGNKNKKMELTLDVEHSVAIKRKPGPQFNWLGEVGVSLMGYR